MPGHKEHITIGTFVAVGILFIIHQMQEYLPFISTELQGIEWILLAGIVYLYSMVPDIDSDISVINKIWNTSAGLGGLYCLYTGQYKILGLFAIGSIVALEWVKHRGVCHEEWFGVILAAPLWIINPLFAIVAFTCFISHTVADRDFMR
jgi:hypothetical protein